MGTLMEEIVPLENSGSHRKDVIRKGEITERKSQNALGKHEQSIRRLMRKINDIWQSGIMPVGVISILSLLFPRQTFLFGCVTVDMQLKSVRLLS